jgi:predicted DsbA family dithiol-disulfide isomerase
MKNKFLLTSITLIIITNLASFFLARKVFPVFEHEVVLIEPTNMTAALDPSRFEGKADASLSIIECSDFRCPFSRRLQKTLKELEQAYPGKIRSAFITFPIRATEERELLGRAVIAAGMQGRAMQMKEMLFAAPSVKMLDAGVQEIEQDILQCAINLSLNMDLFKKDLISENIKIILKRDIELVKLEGVISTPTLFINGYRIKGAKGVAVYINIINKIL